MDFTGLVVIHTNKTWKVHLTIRQPGVRDMMWLSRQMHFALCWLSTPVTVQRAHKCLEPGSDGRAPLWRRHWQTAVSSGCAEESECTSNGENFLRELVYSPQHEIPEKWAESVCTFKTRLYLVGELLSVRS